MLKRIINLVCCILFLGLLVYFCKFYPKTYSNLQKRINEYAHAIDYEFENPQKIYDFMTLDYKSKMSEAKFVKAFNKERSYPYITGLYITKPVIKDKTALNKGEVEYTVAARLSGMKYKVKYIFENNNYYFVDWEEFLDNSYLEKFDNLFYTLDWYYDPNNNTK